jgi:hypothetical protein
MPNQAQAPEHRRTLSRPIVITCLAAFVAFLILNGHGDHLLSLVPLLVLLACPLMHMFMHHGHGSHEGVRPQSGRFDGGPMQ